MSAYKFIIIYTHSQKDENHYWRSDMKATSGNEYNIKRFFVMNVNGIEAGQLFKGCFPWFSHLCLSLDSGIWSSMAYNILLYNPLHRGFYHQLCVYKQVSIGYEIPLPLPTPDPPKTCKPAFLLISPPLKKKSSVSCLVHLLIVVMQFYGKKYHLLSRNLEVLMDLTIRVNNTPWGHLILISYWLLSSFI